MNGPQAMPEDDEAQRTLEKRSLRNVRALLDKIEREEELERRTRRLLGWTFALVLVAAAAGMYAWTQKRGSQHEQARTIVVAPAHR